MTPLQKQQLRQKRVHDLTSSILTSFMQGTIIMPIDSPLHSLLKYHPANKDFNIEIIEWNYHGFIGYKK